MIWSTRAGGVRVRRLEDGLTVRGPSRGALYAITSDAAYAAVATGPNGITTGFTILRAALPA